MTGKRRGGMSMKGKMNRGGLGGGREASKGCRLNQ